jgi:glutathione synthase/RimK-type ligase-like ATP-grasp enzyme
MIMYVIEHYLNIPVFPNNDTAWHYDNKVAQCYLLSSYNASIPKTWVFWREDDALRWIENAQFPIVFKLSTGAGSANVQKIMNKNEAIELTKTAFRKGFVSYLSHNSLKKGKRKINKSVLWWLKEIVLYGRYNVPSKVQWKPEFDYILFQEFLPDNQFDTRITVIGDRAFGFRRLNRENDFRASGSGIIDYDPHQVDLACVKIAFEVSQKMKAQSLAFDFLLKENKYVINEISYTFVDHAIYDCPGHWNSELNWIDRRIWPQEAQAEDFLNYIKNLK